MLTIYGRANSSNVQLVMWTVAELGLRYRRLDYGHEHGGTDTPEYRAMNPMGLVPVMRDGDVVMFESAAILRYLASRYGACGLWPTDPILRGPLDSWAEWGKTSFAPAINTVFHNTVRLAPARQSPTATASAVAEAVRLAVILNDRLATGPWLGGQAFTFADIAVGHNLYRYYTLRFDRPDTPHLDAYWQRLKDRPAYVAHAMKSFEALRGSS